MKSLSKFASISFLSCALFAACQKDLEQKEELPKPSGFGNITFVARSSTSTPKTIATKTGSVVSTDSTVFVDWSHATVYVEKIAFKGKQGNMLDTLIMVEKNLDILSGDALAGVISLPAGSYKDVEVKMACKKHIWPELAFFIKGTFNTIFGTRDSIILGSSLPFEAALSISEITINPDDNYKATFNFELSKVLTGISTSKMETAVSHIINGKKAYYIFRGGSETPPLFDQLLQNWQSVANVVITKEP